MNNIAITIQTTDGRTLALGYNPKFYKLIEQRNADIVKDLQEASKTYGDTVGMVSVAEWSPDEQPSGIAYDTIDEVLKVYLPKPNASKNPEVESTENKEG